MMKKKVLKESGAAMVETALIVPILLGLMVLVVYVTSMLRAHSLMTNASHEGARFMSRQTGLNPVQLESKIDTLTPNSILTYLGTGVGAGYGTHQQVLIYLKALQQRDSNFKIQNVLIQTEYQSEPSDTVRVLIKAEVSPVESFSSTLLEPLGISTFSVSTQSIQPYLY